MKKTKILIFTLLLMPALSIKADALTKPVPTTGGFDCTYQIDYQDGENNNNSVRVKLTGDADQLAKINFNWLDGECDAYTVNCEYKNLSYAFNHSKYDYSGQTYAWLNYTKLNLLDFVTNDGKWTCPTIKYNAGIGTKEGVTLYVVDIGNGSANYSKTADVKVDNSTQPTNPTIRPISQCTYSIQGSNLVGTLDSSKSKISFSLEGNNASKDVNYSGSSCPSLSDLTLCMSTIGSDWYVSYNSKTCSANFTAYNASEVTDPGKDGSGSTNTGNNGTCCVYKNSSNQSVYLYTMTETSTNTKIFAGCLGTDCMSVAPTKNPNGEIINLQNRPDFKNYANNIGNCNNMPQSIWYATVDEKIKFYTSEPSGISSTEARLSLDESCSSDIKFSSKNNDFDFGDKVEVNCEGILGKDLINYINKLFGWIKISVPILLIVFGCVDFGQAILSDDKDVMKKATSKFVKRCIVAIIIFFLPTLLSFLLNIFNALTTEGGISVCGIG